MGYHLMCAAATYRRTVGHHAVDDGDAAMGRRVDAAAAAIRAATFQNLWCSRSIPERDTMYNDPGYASIRKAPHRTSSHAVVVSRRVVEMPDNMHVFRLAGRGTDGDVGLLHHHARSHALPARRYITALVV